ncbi:sugar transferase [Campylobacter jejuni subsp. doylei]|uniref:Sugar transferase n=1 Tax=Campylobacter jejuni subsp. doylei TaxID=32021 RepID=A0A448JBG7_CAMJU|nr:sugar transferase [Campylobacter jejuni subsp. doylei]
MGGGYLTLFKKLYKIKKQHQKEKQIYQETIKVFPQLKYPNLETCPDYSESLRYKFHLSYMLGEVLIKAGKIWHKGGGFKLKNNIKKVNKEFQIFREIFKEFDQINSSVLKGLIDNKQLFLKEFPRIKNILKIHQDYKAILDNIFHNFNYFIQNFDLIEEWLLSDDFKEKYKKENHPYPSLLDPKKLNDENEEINYHNIPAELAWEMNLPLPDRYEFIHLAHFGSAYQAMRALYFYCNLKVAHCFSPENGKITYNSIYDQLFSHCNVLYLDGFNMTNKGQYKFFNLIAKKVPLVTVVRDPIERFKPLVNHLTHNPNTKHEFNLSDDPEIILDSVRYYNIDNSSSTHPNVKNITTSSCGYMSNINFSLKSRIDCLTNITKIIYLDMDKIIGKNTFNTMKVLSRILGFNIPNSINQKKFNGKINGGDFLGLLPRTLRVSCSKNKDILITITTHQQAPLEIYDITNKIFNNKLFSDEILIFMENEQNFNIIYDDYKLFDKISKYFKRFIYILEEQIKKENEKRVQVQEILSFFKNHRDIYDYFSNIFKFELQDLENSNFKIIKKWNAYEQFNNLFK